MVLEVEKKVHIQGIPLTLKGFEEVLELSRSILSGEKPSGYIVTLNPEILTLSQKDQGLRSAIQKATLVVPDGIGITWAVKRLYSLETQRIPGIDLAEALINICAQEGLSVFFLGAKHEVSQLLEAALRKKFPRLKILGTHHGYFLEEEQKEVIDQIRKLSPDLVVVGMGAGKQERFLSSLPPDSYRLGIAVGGSLDIWAGIKKRAPSWMRKAGLEWLFRLILEPGRVFRILKTIPFFLGVLWKKIKP